MGLKRFAPVAWYCVRVDHVARPRTRPPVLTVRDRAWAYCRSGALDEDHFWAATRGVPLQDLYREPRALRHHAPLDWIDALREELREIIGFSSCVFHIARTPTPLQIEFDEPAVTEDVGRASLAVDLADAHGMVGRVTLHDAARARFTDQEADLVRAVIAPYAEPIRTWLGMTADLHS